MSDELYAGALAAVLAIEIAAAFLAGYFIGAGTFG